MEKKTTKVVDIDGQVRENPDFPVAVVRFATDGEILVCDPVLSSKLVGNLYGRIMTLVEATTEPSRLKAVKDVFSKELHSWEDEVHKSAFDIAQNKQSSYSIY